MTQPDHPEHCPSCSRGLDHCHGTLIVYSVVEVECSDPDCTDLDVTRHDLVVQLDAESW